jgi:hypothetical protein
VFDIVAPDNDKLALPVEIESIDDSEARLTGTPSAAGHAEPPPEG